MTEKYKYNEEYLKKRAEEKWVLIPEFLKVSFTNNLGQRISKRAYRLI